jgi:hypothetical protein
MSRHEGSVRNDSVTRWALVERANAIAERARWEAVRAGTVAAREDYELTLQWLELVRKASGGLHPRPRTLGDSRQDLPRAD